MFRARDGWTALGVLAGVLLAGCSAGGSGGSSAAPPHAPAGRLAPTSAPGGLPAGIAPLGHPVAVAEQGWTLALSPFQEARSSADAVPAGWTVLRTQVRFTNTTDTLALVPATTLTVRYGALGRAAVPVKDAALPGLPTADGGVKELPGASFTTDLGVAVPPQARGQRVTVTAAATEVGMAEPDNVFYEGTLPGRPSAGGDTAAPAPSTAGSPAAVLHFGTWSSGGVRVSPITLGAAADGFRQASVDLTVDNSSNQPLSGIGTNLQIMTGTALADTATATAGLDYPDAAIAPRRAATETVHFKLPVTALPGQITVEATGPDGTRTTFSGNAG